MEWKALEFNDFSLINTTFHRYPLLLSDYTFTNLWMWNNSRHYQFVFIDDFLCIKFQENRQDLFLYPLGKGSRNHVIEILGNKQIKNKMPFIMRAIPEEGIKDLKGISLSLKLIEETDRADYIYSFEDLLNLKGNKFQSKRNLIHQFNRNFSFEYREINSMNIQQIIETEKEWFKLKQEEGSENMTLRNEHLGILEALNKFLELGLIGGSLWVDNKVIAYSFAEYINQEMLIIHAEKALKEYKGSYQMINNEFLKHIRLVPYINREEDLNLLNLGKAKSSYHPIRQEKKYLLYTSEFLP